MPSKVDPNGLSRVTWEGCSVILDINDGEHFIFARLSPNANAKIDKNLCLLRPLIGCPFGSLFRVVNGKDGPYLSRVTQTEEVEDEDAGNGALDDHGASDESKDNRALVDNNTAQTLTGEDIDAMRSQGVSGDQIVEALIAHSATFEKKTAFSQEKYKLEKQKKYAPTVLVRRPFVRSICDAYFKKHPTRIGFLRFDALSLLLSLANITAYSDILVVDMVGGIITGAVAERLGGTGYVCNISLGGTLCSMDIVRIFNLSNDIRERILRCAYDDLCPDQNGCCDQVQKVVSDSTNEVDGMEKDVCALENTTSAVVMPSTNSDRAVCESIKAGEKASTEIIKSWNESGFSSLIVAAQDMDVWNTMQKLLPHLSNSASFAIYHQYVQFRSRGFRSEVQSTRRTTSIPLAECMHNLQVGKMAIGLQIIEPWLREYQVLPSRTHPRMKMSSFGGYILSGTKISG